jgi:hypothetical protein
MSGPHPLVLGDLASAGYRGVRILDAAILCLTDAQELLDLAVTPATWAVLKTLGLEDPALQAERLHAMVGGRRGRADAQRKAQVSVPGTGGSMSSSLSVFCRCVSPRTSEGAPAARPRLFPTSGAGRFDPASFTHGITILEIWARIAAVLLNVCPTSGAWRFDPVGFTLG